MGNLWITNPLTTISTGNEVLQKFISLKIQYYIFIHPEMKTIIKIDRLLLKIHTCFSYYQKN